MNRQTYMLRDNAQGKPVLWLIEADITFPFFVKRVDAVEYAKKLLSNVNIPQELWRFVRNPTSAALKYDGMLERGAEARSQHEESNHGLVGYIVCPLCGLDDFHDLEDQTVHLE